MCQSGGGIGHLGTGGSFEGAYKQIDAERDGVIF